ncbi:MAG TPA: hypothetical protein VFK06_11245 [Candidatus Angelobacter sp.]|nr:hypothetical protein [Candidatus Angelobacter sp.]
MITVNSQGFQAVSDLVTVEETRLLELQLKLPVAGTKMEISVQSKPGDGSGHNRRGHFQP